ncbi:MAG: hypothetical protein KatS3mg088_289 [Patescibacteria group bacterium]|nr:MAG: hypothetical protein KatS3mg088_289 [Patescibacteria group bacterium]
MKINWGLIFEVFYSIFTVFLVIFLVISAYVFGFKTGSNYGFNQAISQLNGKASSLEIPKPTSTPVVVKQTTPAPRPKIPNWTGPELWEAVNKARVEHGVNPLKQADELCTIASIRLNELLELGKLDGHEGFSSLPERRSDLKWIFEKYTIAEFLIAGASSAQDAVNAWLDTLGHRKLLTGGEYVWGCTYAQNGFGVAIAAFQ